MKLQLEKASYEGRWFDFGDGRLKIRPYPASKSTFAIKDGVVIFFGEQNLDKFTYCLMAWEGMDAEGKPVELTKEAKRKVYDFRLGKATIGGAEIQMSDFVIQKADEMLAEAQEAEKN